MGFGMRGGLEEVVKLCHTLLDGFLIKYYKMNDDLLNYQSDTFLFWISILYEAYDYQYAFLVYAWTFVFFITKLSFFFIFNTLYFSFNDYICLLYVKILFKIIFFCGKSKLNHEVDGDRWCFCRKHSICKFIQYFLDKYQTFIIKRIWIILFLFKFEILNFVVGPTFGNIVLAVC